MTTIVPYLNRLSDSAQHWYYLLLPKFESIEYFFVYLIDYTKINSDCVVKTSSLRTKPVRSSPSQRVKSSPDLERRRTGVERDIARLQVKILRNHRQIERIRQHNLRLTARLTAIEGRTNRERLSPVSDHFSPVEIDLRSPLAAKLPNGGRHRLKRHSIARTIVYVLVISILAIGCGCIGFAIARMLLR
jgi:hypothetical protein